MTTDLAPRGDLLTLDQILDEIRGPIALALAMNRTDLVALVFHTHAREIEAAYIAEHDLYPWRNGPITPTQPAGLSLADISAEDGELTAECLYEDDGDAPDTQPITIRAESQVA